MLTVNLLRKTGDKKSGGMEQSFGQVRKEKIECWYCKEKGHIKQHCPKKKKDDEEAKNKDESKEEKKESHAMLPWSG